MAESEAAARELAGRLPAAQSPGFQEQWAQLREFKGRLAGLGGRTWATSSLVLVNLAVFAAMAASARRLGAFDPNLLLGWGINFGAFTVNGQWWRLLTCLFVHLNLLHLLVNLWALWNAGRLAERLYGSAVFVFIYLASGLLGSLASIAWQPANASAGASGAIFGILGAHLAFLAHRESGIPRQIVRAHWFSTLVFVLFNLIRGAMVPGIDNAAHVGGLAGGLILGWILFRPLEPEARQDFPFHKSIASVFVLGSAVLLALGQVLGFGSQLTPAERYLRAHDWYLNGQSPNLALWQELASQGASGTVSDAALGARFEKEIVPFWQVADERLRKEAASVPADQKGYAALVSDLTQLRLKWAQTIVQATENRDQAATTEAVDLMRQTDLAQARLERAELRSNISHRARALADSAPAAAVRAFFARRPQCVEAPLAWGPRVAPTDSLSDGPAARHRAGCLAQGLFLSGDYPRLDALMTHAVGSLGDLPDGSSTYEGIVRGLDNLLYFGQFDVGTLLTRTANWRRAVPDSVQAELIESQVFVDWAWGARGHGAANEVSQQSWALFAHRMEMAHAALQDLSQPGIEQPLWYALSLDVGLNQALDAEALRATFDLAAVRFPKYRPLYRSMLRALMPRWGGSYVKVDNFIDAVAYGMFDERSHSGEKPERNLETYAALYWAYDSLEQDDINIFKDAFATWPAMKEGMSAMAQHHPQSDVVLNGFARFACLAGDAEEYKQLRPQLTKRYSATAWTAKVTLESCDKKFGIAAAAAKE
ncbi:MAG TPA: rhomboid family intramembrane serine protease [Steroidobacteraceae bacterium]|nr:rhomboid family intramembrane serine protease [Steroidobacteraceae bacterium]